MLAALAWTFAVAAATPYLLCPNTSGLQFASSCANLLALLVELLWTDAPTSKTGTRLAAATSRSACAARRFALAIKTVVFDSRASPMRSVSKGSSKYSHQWTKENWGLLLASYGVDHCWGTTTKG